MLAQWNYDAPGELGLLDNTVRLQHTGQHPGGYMVDATGYDARSRPTGRSWTLFSADAPGLEGVYPVTYKYDRADHVTEVGYPQVGDPQNGGLPAETITTTYSGLGLPMGLDGSLLPTSPDEAYAFATIFGYDNRARLVVGPRADQRATVAAGRRVYDADQRLSQLQTNALGTVVQDRQLDYDAIGNVTERNTFLAAKASARATATTSATGSPAPTPPPPTRHVQQGRPAAGTPTTTTLTPTAWTATSPAWSRPRPDRRFPVHVPDRCPTARPDRHRRPLSVRRLDLHVGRNGQQFTRTVGGNTDTLVWGPDRLLDEIREANGNVKNSFVYDADGNRLVRRNVDRATAYIEGHEIEANNSGSEVKVVRTYSLEGTPVATRTAQHGVEYLITDNQNSVELVIPTGSDTPSQQRTYAPYGQKRTSDEPATDQGWIGEIEDDRTGLNYLNARYYDPVAGRFLSPDPLYDQRAPNDQPL